MRRGCSPGRRRGDAGLLVTLLDAKLNSPLFEAVRTVRGIDAQMMSPSAAPSAWWSWREPPASAPTEVAP